MVKFSRLRLCLDTFLVILQIVTYLIKLCKDLSPFDHLLTSSYFVWPFSTSGLIYTSSTSVPPSVRQKVLDPLQYLSSYGPHYPSSHVVFWFLSLSMTFRRWLKGRNISLMCRRSTMGDPFFFIFPNTQKFYLNCATCFTHWHLQLHGLFFFFVRLSVPRGPITVSSLLPCQCPDLCFPLSVLIFQIYTLSLYINPNGKYYFSFLPFSDFIWGWLMKHCDI